jgi:nitrite reductase/ring-hydroxylating ferredoxin subunit
MVQKKSMAFVKVGSLKLLPPGSATQLEMDDGSAVAVCNVAGALHAIDGICPHAGGPLGHGALDGPILTCPFHGWEFDCRTGTMAGDDLKLLATYPVKVDDGEIFVELP